MRHHILLVILFSALSTSAPASTENSAFPKLCAEAILQGYIAALPKASLSQPVMEADHTPIQVLLRIH